MIFTRLSKTSRPSSALALALVLVATGTVGVVALEQPAFAEKKKKKDKKSDDTNFSKEFVEAYKPFAEQTSGEAPDWATLAGQVPSLKSAVQTDDDRMIAGNLLFRIGSNIKDPALQLEGAEMMIASGKVPAENQSEYNLLAGQLSYNAKDFMKSRSYFLKSIELGIDDAKKGEAQGLIAESYFNEEDYATGLDYLSTAIATREEAGAEVSDQWIRRGLQIAYNNKLKNELSRFTQLFVKHVPSQENWGEAVALIAYGSDWKDPEILDLVRLAREADALRDPKMYADYIDSADYRRLPGEVVAVIDEGYAKGVLDKSIAYIADIRGQAVDRAQTDRADLSGIIQEATASSDTQTIMTGADLALSYGNYVAAETLYTKLLEMNGVDTNLVRTRLGIAQFEQGEFAEAQESFDAVTGERASIAGLWSIYASQQSGA